MTKKSPERQLTQREADRLIALIKETVDTTLRLPAAGQKHVRFSVIASNEPEVFDIQLYQGAFDPQKQHFTALLDTPKIRIMHLCINGHKHRNPDGTVIGPTHLHIYREGFSDGYAIPIDITSPDFADNLMFFLKEFNVVTDNVSVQRSLL